MSAVYESTAGWSTFGVTVTVVIVQTTAATGTASTGWPSELVSGDEYTKTVKLSAPSAPLATWRWFDMFRTPLQTTMVVREMKPRMSRRPLIMPRQIEQRRQKLKRYRQRLKALQ